jgi:hypothetical protein
MREYLTYEDVSTEQQLYSSLRQLYVRGWVTATPCHRFYSTLTKWLDIRMLV